MPNTADDPSDKNLTVDELRRERQRVVDRLKKEPGYKRVWVDQEGRVAVEVDTDPVHSVRRFDPELGKRVLVEEPVYKAVDLYRRAWGAEWPIVRSTLPTKKGEMYEFKPEHLRFSLSLPRGS